MAIKLLEKLKQASNSSSRAAKVSDSSGNGAKTTKSSSNSKTTSQKSQSALSIFDGSDNKSTNSIQKNSNQTQEQILAKLRAAGLKTTHINKNETDFAQYTAALSDKLKKEILDSYDCEADYILQQEILGLYKKRHDIKNGDFAATLKKMGYTVSRKSEKTTYLTDWKSGRHSTYREGHISVYTVTDPKTGAEIKIADTNGNGAIEVEEVVANEFLSGISAQIDLSNFKNVAVSSGGSAGGLASLSSKYGQNSAQTTSNGASSQESYSSDGKLKLNERQYNLLKQEVVKEFEQKGLDSQTATSKAQSRLREKCMISDEAKNIRGLDEIAQSIAA